MKINYLHKVVRGILYLALQHEKTYGQGSADDLHRAAGLLLVRIELDKMSKEPKTP